MDDSKRQEIEAMRKLYIPKGALLVRPKDFEALIALYTNRRERPCAIIFKGRSTKPFDHSAYRDEEHRTEMVTKMLDSLRQREAEKQAGREALKKMRHNVKVGDIFYTIGGYEQTRVSFYKVTALAGKTMVMLSKVSKCSAPTDKKSDDGWGWKVVAGDELIGEPKRRRVQMDPKRKNVWISVGHEHATPWDGKPKTESGHH